MYPRLLATFLAVPLLAAAALGQAAERVDRFGDPLPDGVVCRLGTVRFRHGAPVGFIAPALGGRAIVTVGGGVARLWNAADGRQLWRCRLSGFPEIRLPEFGVGVAAAVTSDGKILAAESAGQIAIWDLVGRRSLGTLGEGGHVVATLAISADGKTVAAGEHDGTIRLWDVGTRQMRGSLAGVPSRPSSLAFSPDGRLLAASIPQHGIQVWDTAKGGDPRPIEGAPQWPGPLCFSPDGKLLAAARGSLAGRTVPLRGELGKPVPAAELWDLTSGKKRRGLGEWEEAAVAISFSPDGKRLAAVGPENPLTAWDVDTGEEIMYARTATDLSVAAYMPDGERIACASEAGTVTLWDAHKGREARDDREPSGPVSALTFSPDGQSVAGAAGGSIRVWHVRGSEQVQLFDRAFGQFWVSRRTTGLSSPALMFSPDGRDLVAADGAWLTWDVASGRLRRREALGRMAALQGRALADGGKVCATSRRETVVVQRESGGRSEWTVGNPGQTLLQSLTLSPDGRTVAVAYTTLNANPLADTVLSLHEASGGKEMHRWELQLNLFAQPVFSPDGSLLAWADANAVRIVSALTGKDVRKIEAVDGDVAALSFQDRGSPHVLAFSDDGRMLAVGSAGGAIVWEVATGLKRGEFASGHRGGVRSLAFEPGGRGLATGGDDSTVLLWDLSGGRAPLGGGAPDAPAPPSERLWDDLAERNGARARRAVWALARAPGGAAFLARKLRPVASADAARVAALIGDLDSDSFETRTHASDELARIGEPAAPALREAAEKGDSPEVQRRAHDLLDRLDADRGPQRWREIRAVEALEHTASPDAPALLKSLATGAPDAPLTKEARAALDRLARRGDANSGRR